jgi:N-acetylneuraminate synthase
MEIGTRKLGPGEPVYIVAEIGGNHNGDLKLALKQIDLAKEAGATMVKFQKRTLPDAIPEAQRAVMKDTPWGKLDYVEYRERLEFNKAQYEIIDDHCRNVGIDWFVSVWDEAAVDFMEPFYPIAYKIGSPCLTDDGLLRRVAATGRPVILSTGGSTPKQVKHAIDGLDPICDSLVICQCTSSYPTDPTEINLRVLILPALSFRSEIELPTFQIGYSGHELGTAISIAAVALGAVYLERHFTNDKTQWGSDQALSLEPAEFAEMVKGVREVEAAMGDGVKVVYSSEKSKLASLRRFMA